jgi:hypothetical protein
MRSVRTIELRNYNCKLLPREKPMRMHYWLLLLLSLAMPLQAQQAPPSRELRVLFVGNSLTYVNNLPATLRALAAAQPQAVRITTATYVAPGGTVAERWKDDVAPAALRQQHWDAVVLQERGGLLACMSDAEQRQHSECRASERAHREFAALAKAASARTLLLATWGPDQAWQLKLDRAIRQLASRTSAEVVPAGSTLRAWAATHTSEATFPDKIHPSLPATLIMAAQLYRAITGNDAQAADVTLDFALLPPMAAVKPDAPLEQQAQLKGDGRKVVVKADAMKSLLEAAAR